MEHRILYVMRHIDAGGYIEIPYKKIGITGSGNATLSSRLRQISSTKSPIKAQCVAAWEFPKARDLESALHQFLDDKRVEGEWFLDLDNNLVERLKPLMILLNATEIDIENDEDSYTKNVLSKEPQNVMDWKSSILSQIEKRLEVTLRVTRPNHGLTFFNDDKSLTYYVNLRKSGSHNLCVGKANHIDVVTKIFESQGFDVLSDKAGYPYVSNVTPEIISDLINLIEASIEKRT
ncbi:GIY-YIG nuclease family protein [Vibrio cholerae]|uniref:GIY-YIG nuclease family protein n=1 Tax=Vibrio cholerae TaxID=666 RepID=UPI00155F55FB|nr:GIY-YIG nuclease family protein [Vibrio cholerae]NOF44094.1 GIY-YIG nuclease family protein [Vibrio cholerae]NOF57096.1 GIY-YIG nuclease family protein [Vibrio cholerae]